MTTLKESSRASRARAGSTRSPRCGARRWDPSPRRRSCLRCAPSVVAARCSFRQRLPTSTSSRSARLALRLRTAARTQVSSSPERRDPFRSLPPSSPAPPRESGERERRRKGEPERRQRQGRCRRHRARRTIGAIAKCTAALERRRGGFAVVGLVGRADVDHAGVVGGRIGDAGVKRLRRSLPRQRPATRARRGWPRRTTWLRSSSQNPAKPRPRAGKRPSSSWTGR